MQHFIVDCSQALVEQRSEQDILQCLHDAVNATGLFDEADIKVRVNPYRVFATGGAPNDFIHVFSHIMQGRTVEQRAGLARTIVGELAAMFPGLDRIATNIAEFERETYFNRAMMVGQADGSESRPTSLG
jgi:5-carboxymethyl-2-hydroxymuconate isomerase